MRSVKTVMAVLCCVLLLGVAGASAQHRIYTGGNFTLGFPQNDFAENVDNIGFGATGLFLYNFPRSPLSIGGSLNFLIYGSETYEEQLIGGVPVFVDVTTTNNIVMGHLLLRLQPPRGPFLPYVDGLLGFNYLWTRTSIEDQDDLDEIASTTNFDDITFSYGGGVGIMFRVFQARRQSRYYDGPKAVYIDISVRYLRGGDAEYLREGSIEQDAGGDIIYDVSQSTTDIMTYHIGATVAL